MSFLPEARTRVASFNTNVRVRFGVLADIVGRTAYFLTTGEVDDPYLDSLILRNLDVAKTFVNDLKQQTDVLDEKLKEDPLLSGTVFQSPEKPTDQIITAR